jgi:hypothetical protein
VTEEAEMYQVSTRNEVGRDGRTHVPFCCVDERSQLVLDNEGTLTRVLDFDSEGCKVLDA